MISQGRWRCFFFTHPLTHIHAYTCTHTRHVAQSQKGSTRIKCGSKFSELNPIFAGREDGGGGRGGGEEGWECVGVFAVFPLSPFLAQSEV